MRAMTENTMERTVGMVPGRETLLQGKMVQLTNILVGMDFSLASERALDNALALARRYEAKVVVAHVATEPNAILAPEMMPQGYEGQIREAQERMGDILISGKLRGVAHETVIGLGALWPTVEALIGKHRIDLVVVGTNGAGGLQKLLIGSGAEQIFRQAKCPVMTVGPAATEGAPKETEFKNILFATDFGDAAEYEAEYAFSFAQEHQANLTLLHVVRNAEDYSEEGLSLKREATIHELKELAPAGGELWCRTAFRMRLGDPVEEILAVAREMKADLLVIGAKRQKGLAVGHTLNTVAYKLVCGAPCPVLTVRS